MRGAALTSTSQRRTLCASTTCIDVGSPTMTMRVSADLAEFRARANAEAADFLIIGERVMDGRLSLRFLKSGVAARTAAMKPFISAVPRPY